VNGDDDVLEVVIAAGARQILEADQQFMATRRHAGQDLFGLAFQTRSVP